MLARTERLTSTVAPVTVTITGTISDPSGYPLAGVTIVLFEGGHDEGSSLGTTTTDDVGRYRFTRVHTSAGARYRVAATDESGAHVATSSSFTIGSGITTTHDATMPIAGHVQGTVTTQEGSGPARPASHICVTAVGEDIVQAVYVSATGRFRLGGLPSGTYAVTFEDDDATARSTTVTVTAGSTTTIEEQVLNHRQPF